MAKWSGSERPPVHKFLYLQCDCDDGKYAPVRGFSPEAFTVRLSRSKSVCVPPPSHLLIPDEMSEDREVNRCAWLNRLGQYEFTTMTMDKTNRMHIVKATLDGGTETEWVCKHVICVARYIGRRLWNARHLVVHLSGDPQIEALLKWHKHLAGNEWKEPNRMWLTRHVCVTGWGHYDYKSCLFGQKRDLNEIRDWAVGIDN